MGELTAPDLLNVIVGSNKNSYNEKWLRLGEIKQTSLEKDSQFNQDLIISLLKLEIICHSTLISQVQISLGFKTIFPKKQRFSLWHPECFKMFKKKAILDMDVLHTEFIDVKKLTNSWSTKISL